MPLTVTSAAAEPEMSGASPRGRTNALAAVAAAAAACGEGPCCCASGAGASGRSGGVRGCDAGAASEASSGFCTASGAACKPRFKGVGVAFKGIFSALHAQASLRWVIIDLAVLWSTIQPKKLHN